LKNPTGRVTGRGAGFSRAQRRPHNVLATTLIMEDLVGGGKLKNPTGRVTGRGASISRTQRRPQNVLASTLIMEDLVGMVTGRGAGFWIIDCRPWPWRVCINIDMTY